MRQPLAGRPQILPRINRALILDALRRGEASRTALARATGLSLPAVGRIVAEMIAEGSVVEVGPGPRSGGRRPVHLRLNPAAAHAAGAEVGPSRVAVGVCDLEGRVAAFLAEGRPPGQSGGQLVAQLGRLLHAACARAGVPAAALHGLGVGVAGTVAPDGATVRAAPGLPWEGGDARTPLQEALGVAVTLDNDVNMALRGEAWRGAAAGRRHVLAVAVGTGIGAAILADGRLLRGAHGAAGELGYWAAPSPPADGFGPFESLAGVPGIVRRYGGGARTAAEVFARARQGEVRAREVVAATAAALGQAIGNAALLLDPELVLLGGEVLAGADLLVPAIARVLDAVTLHRPPLVPFALGPHAVVVGGVRAVFAAEEATVPVWMR
jgi:predicted NBD/HSP70 family sugar kinase